MQIGQLQWLYASSDCTASSDTVVARATVVVFLPAEPGEARELRRRFPLMSQDAKPSGRSPGTQALGCLDHPEAKRRAKSS